MSYMEYAAKVTAELVGEEYLERLIATTAPAQSLVNQHKRAAGQDVGEWCDAPAMSQLGPDAEWCDAPAMSQLGPNAEWCDAPATSQYHLPNADWSDL